MNLGELFDALAEKRYRLPRDTEVMLVVGGEVFSIEAVTVERVAYPEEKTVIGLLILDPESFGDPPAPSISQ